MSSKKILLLGSSSWVAHYLIPELQKLEFEVIGISNGNRPVHQIPNYLCNYTESNFMKIIAEQEVDYIFNLLGGSDYSQLEKVNEKLSAFCLKNEIHYIYTSSANAIDGSGLKEHDDNVPARGSSEYGKHKARCENYLREHHKKATIIRFAATHGWAPNRMTRTTEFLSKLKEGKTVAVPRGIFQNRTFTGHLAKMMARIAQSKKGGVFNLGTRDQSEEFVFLRNLAASFGYSKDKITQGDPLEFYATVWPNRLIENFGENYSFSEVNTIEALKKSEELQKYKNN